MKMPFVVYFLGCLVFYVCQTSTSAVPEGYRLNVESSCGSDGIEDADIIITTDMVKISAFAKCANGLHYFTTNDQLHFHLNVSYISSNVNGCVFFNHSGGNVYFVDVTVMCGEPGVEIQFESTKTVTCSFGPIDEHYSFEHDVINGLIAPKELQTLKGPDSGVSLTILLVDVKGNDITGTTIPIGKTVRLLLEASNNTVAGGLYPVSCDVVGAKTKYGLLRAGCGDGVVFAQNMGFLTSGLMAASPYFRAFGVGRDNVLKVACTVAMCTSQCNGNSCKNERMRRAAVPLEDENRHEYLVSTNTKTVTTLGGASVERDSPAIGVKEDNTGDYIVKAEVQAGDLYNLEGASQTEDNQQNGERNVDEGSGRTDVAGDVKYDVKAEVHAGDIFGMEETEEADVGMDEGTQDDQAEGKAEVLEGDVFGLEISQEEPVTTHDNQQIGDINTINSTSESKTINYENEPQNTEEVGVGAIFRIEDHAFAQGETNPDDRNEKQCDPKNEISISSNMTTMVEERNVKPDITNNTVKPMPENITTNNTVEHKPETTNNTVEHKPENINNNTMENKPENITNNTAENKPEIANNTVNKPENNANNTTEKQPENLPNNTENKPEDITNNTVEHKPEINTVEHIDNTAENKPEIANNTVNKENIANNTTEKQPENLPNNTENKPEDKKNNIVEHKPEINTVEHKPENMNKTEQKSAGSQQSESSTNETNTVSTEETYLVNMTITNSTNTKTINIQSVQSDHVIVLDKNLNEQENSAEDPKYISFPRGTVHTVDADVMSVKSQHFSVKAKSEENLMAGKDGADSWPDKISNVRRIEPEVNETVPVDDGNSEVNPAYEADSEDSLLQGTKVMYIVGIVIVALFTLASIGLGVSLWRRHRYQM